MDLVFRFGERFYLVDWKSNFLGSRLDDYAQEALQKAMTEHFYHLQYHLYVVAIHKYLATRLPGYRYDSHFGGVYYFFLRGVDPAGGSAYGIYRHRPSEATIEALCQKLMGSAGP
jgi:exodeoxyribonuclease V beta subunit